MSKGDPFEHRAPSSEACSAIYSDRSIYWQPCSAIASASPYAEAGRSYVDLERGIFYRKPIGKRATKKRQTPAPIPPRLLAHLRRWKDRKLFATCFVEFNGKPVRIGEARVQSGVGLAGLAGKVTPHTLRHTAATWLMQRGVPIWEAAGFLGMSAGGPPGDLRPPSSGLPARGSRRDWPKRALRFGGRNGGRLDRRSKSETKNPNDFWSEWQDSNLRPLRPERSALPG